MGPGDEQRTGGFAPSEQGQEPEEERRQDAQGQGEEAPCDWRSPVGDGELAQADDQPNPDAVEAAKQAETCDPPADWRSPGG